MATNENSSPETGSLRRRLQIWRKRIQRAAPFASGVLATLLALILYHYLFPANQLTSREVNLAIQSAMASATPRPAYSAGVYQIIQPSLVLIQADLKDNDKSLGSGVIINDAGNVLTSLHVVNGATKISLIFADGTKSDATILSSQPNMDIALLQPSILPETYVPALLGNPGAMQVGDEAYVVGHPFGLYDSMSSGVISGFNRTFQPKDSTVELHGLIQFDAAANPGNSGGPLLNRYGQVIGIVTGIVNPTSESFFVGIAFAVPITSATAGGGGSPPY